MSNIIGYAACQSKWTVDTDANLARMEELAHKVKETWGDSIQIISFCEMAVQGSWHGHEAEFAQTIPGPASDRLCSLAKETGLYICNGSMYEFEPEDGKYYNTSILCSPQGEIVLKYRKTHPMTAMEISEPGREYPVVDLPGIGKVAIMICYDACFPEVSRAFAYNGAEIIIWPHMMFHPVHQQDVTGFAKNRAFENGCFVLGVCGSNVHEGIGLIGHSCIADPYGYIRAEADDGETILPFWLDMDMVTKARMIGPDCIPPSQLSLMAAINPQYPQYNDISRFANYSSGKLHFEEE